MKLIPAATMALALSFAVDAPARADLVPTTGLDYNLIDFGDYTQSAVDITGRLAVQGNMSVANFAVGMALTGAPSGSSLVVGGNLSWASGSVFGGNTQVGGAASVTNFGEDAGTQLIYATPGANPPPSWLNPVVTANGGIASNFFSSALSYATALSATFDAIAPTAATDIGADGHLYFNGASAGLNVFSVDAAQLAAASWHGIDIAAAAGATVVINIDGDGGIVSADDLPLTLSGGISAGYVVYNFVNTTAFDSTNIGWLGSVLAPGALYNGVFGNIDGDIVVAGVTGSTEFHAVPFIGDPPTTGLTVTPVTGFQQTPVPEPSSFVMLLAGLGALPLLRRRRRAA